VSAAYEIISFPTQVNKVDRSVPCSSVAGTRNECLCALGAAVCSGDRCCREAINVYTTICCCSYVCCIKRPPTSFEPSLPCDSDEHLTIRISSLHDAAVPIHAPISSISNCSLYSKHKHEAEAASIVYSVYLFISLPPYL